MGETSTIESTFGFRLPCRAAVLSVTCVFGPFAGISFASSVSATRGGGLREPWGSGAARDWGRFWTGLGLAEARAWHPSSAKPGSAISGGLPPRGSSRGASPPPGGASRTSPEAGSGRGGRGRLGARSTGSPTPTSSSTGNWGDPDSPFACLGGPIPSRSSGFPDACSSGFRFRVLRG